MNTTLVRFLSCLSRATLDPALGGRGMALSRVLSLAAFGSAKDDADALKSVDEITARIERALNTPRHLTHEEWNELQASAETGHWFLRADFPQVSASGTVDGGYQAPVKPVEAPAHTPETYIVDESDDTDAFDPHPLAAVQSPEASIEAKPREASEDVAARA